MISALFPQEKRARMLGIWNAAIPLGGALGVALGGIIAQHFGWRHSFGIMAIPEIIVALLFFKVKDYRTGTALKRPCSFYLSLRFWQGFSTSQGPFFT